MGNEEVYPKGCLEELIKWVLEFIFGTKGSRTPAVLGVPVRDGFLYLWFYIQESWDVRKAPSLASRAPRYTQGKLVEAHAEMVTMALAGGIGGIERNDMEPKRRPYGSAQWTLVV